LLRQAWEYCAGEGVPDHTGDDRPALLIPPGSRRDPWLMPLALARKYRPKSFGRRRGRRPHVSATLKGDEPVRVAATVPLLWPRGTGKTTLARVLAMALNCSGEASGQTASRAGECASCRPRVERIGEPRCGGIDAAVESWVR